MTEMWLVRHGETDWNLRNIVQGQSDIPLNETGLAQARMIALKLKPEPFAAIYASDLDRARTTARIIAEQLNLPVRIDPRLREIQQGSWEGHAISEIIALYPEDFRTRNDHPTLPAAVGAEPVAEVVARMVQAVNDIHAAHPDEKVLLVSHGFAISALYCTINGIPLQEASAYIPDNGHPVIINVEKPLQLPIL